MKLELITLSDMGAGRIGKLVSHVIKKHHPEAKMGQVKDHITAGGCVEVRARLEIPNRPGLNIDRAREWLVEAIRHTYNGPGFVLMVEQLKDNSSLETPDLADDPLMDKLTDDCGKTTVKL